MEIQINVVVYHSPENLERFIHTVTPENQEIVKKSLQIQRQKIIDYLWELHDDEKIKSVYQPKNKKIQEHLNLLVEAKKTLKKSIQAINTIYR